MFESSFKRVRRAVENGASDALAGLRKTLRRASRDVQDVTEQVSAGTKRAGKRAGRHAKDVAGDIADVLAKGAQRLEERVRRERGDRVLRDFPRPIQLDDYSCGVQCTMAMLEYFGHERLEGDLRRELHTTKRYGTDRAAIIELLREYGCRCTTFDSGRRETLRRAIAKGAPVLVEVDGDHWAVVYGVGPHRVYLADPSVRRSRSVVLGWREFRARWDRAGVVASRGRVGRRRPSRC